MSEQVEVKEQTGIDNIEAFLDGIEVPLVGAAKITADGNYNVADIPHVIEIMSNIGKVIQGAQALKNVPAEAKDIDVEEAQKIVLKLYNLANKIAKAREENN